MIERRFSLEDDFMNFKTDDLLFGFMRCLSTAKPTGEYKDGKAIYQEYLTIKEFKKNKKLIAGICGCCSRTIDRHIEALFNAGLLCEGVETIKVNGKDYEYECYYFPYDEKGKFKMIDQKIIKYLVHTRNAHTIRIYLYLLNKYQWKKDYIFTLEEIAAALGYAESTKTCNDLIKDVLASLRAEGIIRYEVIECPIETSDNMRAKTYRMRLDYVLEEVKDLPSFI